MRCFDCASRVGDDVLQLPDMLARLDRGSARFGYGSLGLGYDGPGTRENRARLCVVHGHLRSTESAIAAIETGVHVEMAGERAIGAEVAAGT